MNSNVCNKQISMFGYFLKCIKCYAKFDGRASRKEYWSFVFFYSIIYAISFTIPLTSSISWLAYVIWLFIIPYYTVAWRRMHDTGKSGLYFFIPVYGFILTLTKSEYGSNTYGNSPIGNYCDIECDMKCTNKPCSFCDKNYRLKKSDAIDQSYYCSVDCEGKGENMVCSNCNVPYSLKKTEAENKKSYCSKNCEDLCRNCFCSECRENYIFKTSDAKIPSQFCSLKHENEYRRKFEEEKIKKEDDERKRKEAEEKKNELERQKREEERKKEEFEKWQRQEDRKIRTAKEIFNRRMRDGTYGTPDSDRKKAVREIEREDLEEERKKSIVENRIKEVRQEWYNYHNNPNTSLCPCCCKSFALKTKVYDVGGGFSSSSCWIKECRCNVEDFIIRRGAYIYGY